MEKLQTPGSQAQPCYKPALKSLFDLLSKFLHLFYKDCNGILKCSVFSLVVRDGCRGGDGGGGGSGRWGGDRIGGGSALRSQLSLKVGKTYPREVTSTAAVVADQRAGVLLQAVLVRLGAAATTAILYPLAPLLHDVLVGQSLEVGINVVSINIHCIGIAEIRGGAGSQGRVVTSCACLALVVVQVGELQVDRVAIGLEHVVVLGYNREVGEPIDIIGVQSLFETVKQILLRPAGSRGPSLEICDKLAKSALALFHPNDFVLCVGLGTDRFELQFECHKKGIPACKRRLAFRERLYVGSGPHSCIFGHEGESRGDHFVYVEQNGSIGTLHFFSLGISERKSIFIRVDPNAEGTPTQSGRLRVLALEDNRLLNNRTQTGSGRIGVNIVCLGIYQGLNRGGESADEGCHIAHEIH
jgi:hypothetical protein